MKMFKPKSKLSKEEIETGRIKRQKIISTAQAMRRLADNKDYQLFCELLKEDKEALVRSLLTETSEMMKSNEVRTRLIARINQIDSVLKVPQRLIWQMKNLTEVRNVIKETHDRQAVGNKTGG